MITIPSEQYKRVYLFNAGRKIDVKVTFKMRDGGLEIYIRDFVYYSLDAVLRCLQHIAATELVGPIHFQEETSHE